MDKLKAVKFDNLWIGICVAYIAYSGIAIGVDTAFHESTAAIVFDLIVMAIWVLNLVTRLKMNSLGTEAAYWQGNSDAWWEVNRLVKGYEEKKPMKKK